MLLQRIEDSLQQILFEQRPDYRDDVTAGWYLQ